jgi:O-antigen/teichoic acid export membrane protein
VRGAQLLFGPIYSLYAGVRVAATPWLVRGHAADATVTAGLVRRLAAALGLITLAWGLVVCNLPDSVGEALLGDSWAGTSTVLVVMTWSAVAGGIGFAPVVGLRALAAARHSLRARSTVAVVTLAVGCIGALVGDARGALTGVATAETGGLGVYWRAFRNADREAAPAG